MKTRGTATLTAIALLTGCAGSQQTTVPANGAKSLGPSSAPVRMTLLIPAKSPASSKKRPDYVSASTQSMQVTINGGTPVVMDLTPSSPGCVAGAGGTTCTLATDAPVGNDGFVVALFDQKGANGNPLSSATLAQTVVANQPNTINMTLGGVVKSLALNPSSLSINAGTPQSFNFTLIAKDAQGNTIVGPGSYVADANGTPLSIPLAVFETGSTAPTLALSASSVSSPANAGFTLTYNGKGVDLGTVGTSPPPPGVIGISASIGVTPTITRTSVSPSNSTFSGLVAAPDGSIWATGNDVSGNAEIARVAANGSVTEFPLPNGSSPYGLAIGSDNNLWFTETNGNNVGRMTPSGTVTEFPVAGTNTKFITLGPDANVWATYTVGGVTRVTPAGVSTDFTTGVFPANALLTGIVAGPDGSLWICDQSGNSIDKLTTAGVKTSYPIPTAAAKPFAIIQTGGKLWFTERSGGKIASITTAGAITEYLIPPVGPHQPEGITLGADGNLWFIDRAQATVGAFSPITQAFSAYTFLSSGSPIPLGQLITSGSDGNLYIVDTSLKSVDQLVY